ncbi:MAG: divalent cation tolerance protein CutA [Candidatus Omnitrophica bacterium]|nr:divalent cation tolerance protein CutA [Candidatus Omnitrophota bacterium]
MRRICSVYVTVSSDEEARYISDELLKARLVACANIFSDVTSVYRWKGELREDREVVVVYKTRESLFPRVDELVRSIHSYDNPCLEAFPAVNISSEYAEWVRGETCQEKCE